MRIDARELLAVGIFGRASLSGRIETLLKRGREFSPRASRARIAASVAILLLFAAASALTPRWIVFAQKPVFAQQSSATAFEVASIRPARPGTPWTIRFSAGGRIDAHGVSLRQLIQEAWHVRVFQISGGPAGVNSEWMNSDRYDIAAKADGNPPEAQIRLLTRTLLADRFKLALHTERKEFDVYTLVVAKNGPKLKAAAGAQESSPPGLWIRGAGRLVGIAASIDQLAESLSDKLLNGSPMLDRPVFNGTGLTGAYDFSLEWAPDSDGKSLPAGPSIFSALPDQLGLKLESSKKPIEMLVIDHAEKPDAN